MTEARHLSVDSLKLMVIGLTGGIGCGKTTAAKLFERRGFKRLDCDAIVHELLESDESTLTEVKNRFGEAMIAESGCVDRAALGKIVFSDEKALKDLEAIVHPRVHAVWRGKVASDPSADWIVEIPLLFEKKLEKNVDFTVCVSSDQELQVERLERKGMDRASALTRIDRQLPIAVKIELADFVLLNDGSPEFLESQVERLLNLLMH